MAIKLYALRDKVSGQYAFYEVSACCFEEDAEQTHTARFSETSWSESLWTTTNRDNASAVIDTIENAGFYSYTTESYKPQLIVSSLKRKSVKKTDIEIVEINLP